MEEAKAPGLKYRTRATGERVPYWVASAPGYPLRTANLTGVPLDELPARCAGLEAEMVRWAGDEPVRAFDGTLGALLSIYQTHEESPYRNLKPASRIPYDHYLGKLAQTYGGARLDLLTGLDIKGWHKVWRGPDGDKLGAATTALNVLKAAVTFGRVSGFPHCERLREMMRTLRLPEPAPRDMAPTAADVDKLREAAHGLGYHSAAFCYALQFETTARQWDLIGQWADMSDPRPSAVTCRGEKWIGPTWAAIDANAILTLTPSKTENTTRAKVHVNLSRCPMVMAELALIPEKARRGPLIVNEATRLPYRWSTWREAWRAVREDAGLSPDLWNRDLRAGGITEAEMAGATVDDRAKLAGHSKKVNASVYSRDRLAASDRVVEARERFRRSKP